MTNLDEFIEFYALAVNPPTKKDLAKIADAIRGSLKEMEIRLSKQIKCSNSKITGGLTHLSNDH